MTNLLPFPKKKTSALFFALSTILTLLSSLHAQQDAQYTQYMYNTQIVNPAYAGSRETLSFGVLGRTQWVGFDGAPQTFTFTANAPVGLYNSMGLGLSIVHDQIGPAIESNVNIDFSYTIDVSRTSRLSFGLKGGLDMLDVDYNRLTLAQASDPIFQAEIDQKLQPQAGAGLYFTNDRFYAGVSVPNFLNTKHFDENALEDTDVGGIAVERLHYFLILGHVFDLGRIIKFKPATLLKTVSGAPLQLDVSANFMFNDKFVLGASYRWDASLSAMTGFQISRSFFAGVAYDYQSTNLEAYSDGSYEVFLRFDIFNRADKILIPRFF
ncbi:MAG: type IX secretion system membrane protein PorP/SprF [Bacteroidota bacterium]